MQTKSIYNIVAKTGGYAIIEQDEKLSANHTVQHHPSSNTARIL